VFVVYFSPFLTTMMSVSEAVYDMATNDPVIVHYGFEGMWKEAAVA
jgi:hypothetical protein